MFLTYQFDHAQLKLFGLFNVHITSKVLLRAIGDSMTQDRHYSDNPSHYQPPDPGLNGMPDGMLPTQPPGKMTTKGELSLIFRYWKKLNMSY